MGAQSVIAAEYLDQPYLAQIGITPELHDQVDGAGAVILVLDTPIYQPNPDLIGKAWYYATNPYAAPSMTYDPAAAWHGTAVAVVAAGRRGAQGFVGVAPGANVLGVSVFNNAGKFVADQGTKKALDWAKANPNVFAVNRSFGPINYENPFGSAAELNVLDDYTSRFVIVQSAMNASKNRMFALYAYGMDKLSHIIIAGAVDSNNVIAPWSNKPGQGCVAPTNTNACPAHKKIMNMYMVAPGVGVPLYMNDVFGTGWGTSFAAPQIAGAATLVWVDAKARGVVLPPSDVTAILFSTATDLGAPGVDPVYGRGLLNVAAALAPIGLTSFPVVPGQVVYDRFRRPFKLDPIPMALAPTTAAWSVMMGGETMQVQWKDNVSIYSRQALIDDNAALNMAGVSWDFDGMTMGLSAGALHETYSALGNLSMTPTVTTLTGFDLDWADPDRSVTLSAFYMRGEARGYAVDTFGLGLSLGERLKLDVVKPLSIAHGPQPWAMMARWKASF